MKKQLPFLALMAFALCFILFFYGKPLLNPDAYLFSNQGDALKNYYTYAWHIRHDNSYLQFEGMNYPYREHFLYTDCHPALANLLKLLGSNGGFIPNHSIGILNFLMIFGIFLTFPVIFLLLRQFGQGKWTAVLFSIGITLLAPQIFRLEGHLSLSYSLAIPLSWLLLLKFLEHPRSRLFPILLLLNNLLWMFIHAYLGIIAALFLISLLVVRLFTKNRAKEILKQQILPFLAVLLPVAFFYGFTLLTDTHSGRTDNPSGFFLYNAEFDDVFVPHHPPLAPWLNKISENGIRLQWEAWSYVGLTGTIFTLTLLVLLIMKLIRRKKTFLLQTVFDNPILNYSLIAAFISLLFAMAFPFKQLPILADLIPLIKQFRATGRFTWPFYFALTLFVAVSLEKLWKSAEPAKRLPWLILLIFAGILNIVEGIPYHSGISGNLSKSGNLFRTDYLPGSSKAALSFADSSKYQAIISIPFFYQGSESFSRPIQQESARAGISLSYHSGIPMVCGNLTRTAVQESRNIVQLISPAYYEKAIQKDIHSSKPFLIVRTPGITTENELDLISKASLLYTALGISLYSITPEVLFRNDAGKYLSQYQKLLPGLKKKDSFMVTNDSAFLYYNDYEKLSWLHQFRNNGGYSSPKKGKNVMAEFPAGTFETGKEYKISAWMFNGMKDALNLWFRFIIEEYNPANDSWESTVFYPEQAEVINGDWSLVEGTFTVKSRNSQIFIVAKGKDDAKGPFYADCLLITESGNDVYRLEMNKGRLFMNNQDIDLTIPLR
ncbi:MAG: hypothetical protein IPH88_19875 [Bacteroidales bacterium]|nr:hypothetical protein [Bacteroidales bacterium]